MTSEPLKHICKILSDLHKTFTTSTPVPSKLLTLHPMKMQLDLLCLSDTNSGCLMQTELGLLKTTD